MTFTRFFRACVPVSITFASHSIFNLIEFFIISALGSGVIVLVGSASSTFAVFGAFLDGLRLVIVQDMSRGTITRQHLSMLLRASLLCVLLFSGFFFLWFPKVVGKHEVTYDLHYYGLLISLQAFFYALRACMQGILYAKDREDWVTYITFGGSIFQNLVTSLLVFTNWLPVPKYLAAVTSATCSFALQGLLCLLPALRLLKESNSLPHTSASLLTFLRRALPFAVDRAGVFVGFMLLFGAISRFSTEVVTGYVFISRSVGPAYLAAYGAELVLTRTVSRIERVVDQLRVIGMAMLSAVILGGTILGLEVLFHKPLLRLAFSNMSLSVISENTIALLIACLFQLANFGQIVLSGFLRASGQRWSVLTLNIAIFTIMLPMALYAWPWFGSSAGHLWTFIGCGYTVALALFTSRVIGYLRRKAKEGDQWLPLRHRRIQSP